MNNNLNNQDLNKALFEDIKQLVNTENLSLSLKNTTTTESSGDNSSSENLLTLPIQSSQELLPKVTINSSLDIKVPLVFKADFKTSITTDVETSTHCLCAPLNLVLGDAGRNALNGTEYNDLIIGLQGRDTLIGGAGNDHFVYTSIVDAGDIINDFEVGEDKIVLTDVLEGFGYSGTDPIADGYISFASVASGTVIKIDPDGAIGTGAARSFILAKDVTVGELNDLDNFIYTAGASPNPIIGDAGRNALNGTDGDDIIVGLQGRDTLTGGEGCDQFVYTSIVDAGDIINDFEVGEDKIVLTDVLEGVGYSGTDPIADGYISFASVASGTVIKIDPDGAAGTGAARSFILAKDVTVGELDDLNNFVYTADNSLNEVIGDAGRNELNGTHGNDLIKGLQGRDTLMGGAGCDQFVYTSVVDAGDIISDFEVGHDLIVLTDVLDGVGYSGSDPIADGYVLFGSVASGTVIKIDSDGAIGTGAARNFILAEDVDITDLNDSDNFVF